MIAANELRVNDWVDNTDKYIKVTLDNIKWYKSMHPIPLTPEILEKCGFKKYSHEPGYAINSDEIDERCDEYTYKRLSLMDWGGGKGFTLSNSFSFDLRVDVKYLHQLQNLIFALKGEELDVKL
jgi:hypothetical protein